MDDFSGEKRDDFYKIDDTDEQNSEFQEKSHVTKSSESLTDLTTKKIPNQYIYHQFYLVQVLQ